MTDSAQHIDLHIEPGGRLDSAGSAELAALRMQPVGGPGSRG